MKKLDKKSTKNLLYKCSECGFFYKEKKWTEKCFA